MISARLRSGKPLDTPTGSSWYHKIFIDSWYNDKYISSTKVIYHPMSWYLGNRQQTLSFSVQTLSWYLIDDCESLHRFKNKYNKIIILQLLIRSSHQKTFKKLYHADASITNNSKNISITLTVDNCRLKIKKWWTPVIITWQLSISYLTDGSMPVRINWSRCFIVSSSRAL